VPLTRDVQNQAPQAVCELNPTNVSRNLARIIHRMSTTGYRQAPNYAEIPLG
jgi:hypothetical protein